MRRSLTFWVADMPVKLRIDTLDLDVANTLMGMNGSLALGAETHVPGGGLLRFTKVDGERGARDGALEFELSKEGKLEVEELAQWLYQRLHPRVATVRLDRDGVTVEPEALRRALARKLE